VELTDWRAHDEGMGEKDKLRESSGGTHRLEST
jgi:hypothetical protein